MCITKLRLICMQQAYNSSYESKRGGLTFTQTSSPLAYYQISFILGSIIPLILALCNPLQKSKRHTNTNILAYCYIRYIILWFIFRFEFVNLSPCQLKHCQYNSLAQVQEPSPVTLDLSPGPCPLTPLETCPGHFTPSRPGHLSGPHRLQHSVRERRQRGAQD